MVHRGSRLLHQVAMARAPPTVRAASANACSCAHDGATFLGGTLLGGTCIGFVTMLYAVLIGSCTLPRRGRR
jgi:hypothetical protein